MMCFSRPKSWIRGDDLRVGLILQIMTMIERKSSARAKAAREDSATVSQGDSDPSVVHAFCAVDGQERVKPQTLLLMGVEGIVFLLFVWEPDVPNAIGRTLVRLA